MLCARISHRKSSKRKYADCTSSEPSQHPLQHGHLSPLKRVCTNTAPVASGIVYRTDNGYHTMENICNNRIVNHTVGSTSQSTASACVALGKQRRSYRTLQSQSAFSHMNAAHSRLLQIGPTQSRNNSQDYSQIQRYYPQSTQPLHTVPTQSSRLHSVQKHSSLLRSSRKFTPYSSDCSQKMSSEKYQEMSSQATPRSNPFSSKTMAPLPPTPKIVAFDISSNPTEDTENNNENNSHSNNSYVTMLSRGQVKLSVNYASSEIRIKVAKARSLNTETPCSSRIKVTLSYNPTVVYNGVVVKNSFEPYFDHTFKIALHTTDHKNHSRLHVYVHNETTNKSLGCISFSIRKLIKYSNRKINETWFHLTDVYCRGDLNKHTYSNTTPNAAPGLWPTPLVQDACNVSLSFTTPAHKSVTTAQKSVQPAQKSVTPTQKSATPAQNCATPAQNCVIPAQKSVTPVQKSVTPEPAYINTPVASCKTVIPHYSTPVHNVKRTLTPATAIKTSATSSPPGGSTRCTQIALVADSDELSYASDYDNFSGNLNSTVATDDSITYSPSTIACMENVTVTRTDVCSDFGFSLMSCPRADTIYQHAPEPTVFISHVQFATSSLVENGDLVVTVNGTDVRGDTVASVAAMIRRTGLKLHLVVERRKKMTSSRLIATTHALPDIRVKGEHGHSDNKSLVPSLHDFTSDYKSASSNGSSPSASLRESLVISDDSVLVVSRRPAPFSYPSRSLDSDAAFAPSTASSSTPDTSAVFSGAAWNACVSPIPNLLNSAVYQRREEVSYVNERVARKETLTYVAGGLLYPFSEDILSQGDEVADDLLFDRTLEKQVQRDSDETSNCDLTLEQSLEYSLNNSLGSTRNHVGQRYYSSLSIQASGRHLIIVDIINAEENFIDCMSLAVERFTNPLRHQMLTAAQHDNLFQNIDKLIIISQYHLRCLLDAIDAEGTADNTDSVHIDDLSRDIASVYNNNLQVFCQAYTKYHNGLLDSLQDLARLKRKKRFVKFIRNIDMRPQDMNIDDFLRKPCHHFKELSDLIGQALNMSTDRKSRGIYSQMQMVILASQNSDTTSLLGDSSIGSDIV